MKFKITLLLTCLTLFLVACSSNQNTSFYQLKAIEAESTEQNIYALNPITVLVNPIKFPDYLDRPQIVTRNNEYKLQLSDNHRWAEPLKNEFNRVFLQNLNNRISPSLAVIYSDLNGTVPDIHLTIEVLQFDTSSHNQQAILTVKWAYWTKDKAKQIKRQSKEYRLPIKNKDYESRIEAQSQAIVIFTNDLITSIWTANKD